MSDQLHGPLKGYVNAEVKNDHHGESEGFGLEVYVERGLELKSRYERERHPG